MLLANLGVTEGLVNGTKGIIIGFVTESKAEVQLRERAELRGVQCDDEITNLQTFYRGQSKKFPKVLFETQNSRKEVILGLLC